MSVRLYIGNLPKEEVERQDLQAVFAEEGDSVVTKVIKDRKTGKCRGFGFVTVNDDEHADKIIEKFNGYLFKDTPIKIEKALPRTKGAEEEGEGRSVDNEGSPTTTNSNVDKPAPTRRSNNNNNKKSRRPATSTTTSTSESSEGVQPDPRWAADLEKLKQMLAAQTTNG
ncbi:RNA recognition motif domain-containing protein [Synechocystis sp. PCC 7509]|uniref:RNA recognition motif domain-containing protein n=1 Tax=Synechocystis sp. PCC 7509 TaxID=927677 RepID=UPI0002ACE834|nr:RNA-binding protein [Synechocystis sp. PCC 7509]